MEKKKTREELRELFKNSTQVVSWYPHPAQVRGPFCRWFEIKEVEDRYKKHVADISDDAKFCAAAMNNLVPLLDELDKKDLIIAELKAMLKDVL